MWRSERRALGLYTSFDTMNFRQDAAISLCLLRLNPALTPKGTHLSEAAYRGPPSSQHLKGELKRALGFLSKQKFEGFYRGKKKQLSCRNLNPRAPYDKSLVMRLVTRNQIPLRPQR